MGFRGLKKTSPHYSFYQLEGKVCLCNYLGSMICSYLFTKLITFLYFLIQDEALKAASEPHSDKEILYNYIVIHNIHL